MHKIEKCACSCCHQEKMKFIFVTNQFGNLEVDTSFKVEASYDNSTFIEGYILNQIELKHLLVDSIEIDLMCMDCLNDCNSFDLTYKGKAPKHFEGVSGKELIREVLDDSISNDEGIWTLNDLARFANFNIEAKK